VRKTLAKALNLLACAERRLAGRYWGTNLPFTIQIPIFNETKALAFSSFLFTQMGLRPRYVLDTQSTPETRTLLHRLGHEATFFANDKPFIENGYERFSAISPTDWILRLDCDEALSWEAIEFCRRHVESGSTGVVGLERHQVIWQEESFQTATTERFLPANARQWRLYNRRHVRFDPRIHTPGIFVEDAVAAPRGATMYHLSWVYLDMLARAKKAARYDAHAPGGNSGSWLVPIGEIDWAELDAPDLRAAYVRWTRQEAQARQAPPPIEPSRPLRSDRIAQMPRR
jgi:hypothetical protein